MLVQFNRGVMDNFQYIELTLLIIYVWIDVSRVYLCRVIPFCTHQRLSSICLPIACVHLVRFRGALSFEACIY